ncbi:MAG: ABC transporter ATP-binding protein, partial [Myxococcota bacterium]
RLGHVKLSAATWGSLVAEGAYQAFLRLERVRENSELRCSSGTQHLGESDEGETKLTAVSVTRTGRPVLNDLDLRLVPAEWLLVLGPSGSGKSSLLRFLAGLDAPSEGSFVRLGQSISSESTLKGRLDDRVGLLTQNPEHHFIASTVAEDIGWGLLHRGVETQEARERVRECAATLRIDHLLERPCHELSFGEQRRVALAGLLVLDLKLLLLDEPTAGLDPVAASELLTLVRRFVEGSGATCVWATHDRHSVPPNAQRTVLLKKGRIAFDGPTSQALSKPWLLRVGLTVDHGAGSKGAG